jgi:hypothetical protein
MFNVNLYVNYKVFYSKYIKFNFFILLFYLYFKNIYNILLQLSFLKLYNKIKTFINIFIILKQTTKKKEEEESMYNNFLTYKIRQD